MFNHILLNKYPYFFRHLYKEANAEYKNYYNKYDILCKHRFQLSIKELQNLDKKTIEQKQFINSFYEYMPLICSNSTMNLLCRYIESINFDISKKLKIDNSNEYYKIYRNNKIKYTEDIYTNIKNIISKYISGQRKININIEHISEYNKTMDNEYNIKNDNQEIKKELFKVNKNIDIILNCLIDYFYLEKPKSNKDILWRLYGDIIFKNVKNNSSNKIRFPFPDINGDIKYMGKNYTWKEVEI